MSAKCLFVAASSILLVLTAETSAGSAQQCPIVNKAGIPVSSRSRALEGRLVYHDGIRQWFELKLAKPVCGETSIQLIRLRDKTKSLERFRGCQVRSTGSIDFSPTGYYSANLYQDVARFLPVGRCRPQRLLPDYSNLRPDRSVRAYTVDMHVNYGPGDHPVVFKVRTGGKELKPPEAYASYWLTGSFVLYGRCADGFRVDRVYGTPDARPSHFDDPGSEDDMAAFDPESAAEKGTTDLHLGYTCARAP